MRWATWLRSPAIALSQGWNTAGVAVWLEGAGLQSDWHYAEWWRTEPEHAKGPPRLLRAGLCWVSIAQWQLPER